MGSVVRKLLLASGAALLCIVPATALSAQGGTVTGKVTAQGAGNPIGGAHVIVVGGQGTAVAGDDGKYTLHNVRAGTVELQALNVGYRPLKKTVTVTEGGTATLDFEMEVSVVKLADVVISPTGPAGAARTDLGTAVSTGGGACLRDQRRERRQRRDDQEGPRRPPPLELHRRTARGRRSQYLSDAGG